MGVPAVAKGEAQTGTCTFYIDQTRVIRASDDPTVEAGLQSPAQIILPKHDSPHLREHVGIPLGPLDRRCDFILAD
jgi:hypothetical protein